MAGIGTAARNYWEEEEKKGIGTAATRVPGDGQGQGIGTAATRVPGQNISQPDQGIGTAATRQPGQVEYAPAPAQQQPIQVMQGVTPGTQQKLNGLQTGYQPTTAAQAAQQALQSIQAQKPQGYNSQYAPQLQSILQQIQGQKDFKYEVNSDPFFRMLADRKTTDAKLAGMNAMGQGAALTGGYGNSAAQGQAQQAYQEQLRGLYDEAISLEQRAFERDQARRADLYNQAGLLQGLDQAEYGRYRDTVGDWENERNYLTDLYNTEEDRGYNRFANDLDYYTRLAQIENADYRSEQERQEAIRQFNEQFNRGVFESDRAFEEQRRQADLDEAYRQAQMQENIRQFNESLDWDKMSAQQKYNYEIAMNILANGQMPSQELLESIGLSADDAQKLMAIITTGGGGGTTRQTGPQGESLYSASLRVMGANPELQDAKTRAAQQINAQNVESMLSSGRLPTANQAAAAGLTQQQAVTSWLQNQTPGSVPYTGAVQQTGKSTEQIIKELMKKKNGN